jgi:tetratricopeptide (TPR) repeat protein
VQAVGGAFLLAAITIIAYLPALHAGFVFDDSGYVTENESLRTLAGLGRIWTAPQHAGEVYYPLTFTSLWLDYHLWGLQPFGYHCVNICLHALTAVMLWYLLRRLRVPAAWMAAAIFAVHPIHVESVAWVTERKNVLSGVFGLAALVVFLGREGGAPRALPWRAYLTASLLFIASLLAKSVTLTLPVVLVLLLWWEHGRIATRTLWWLAPLVLISLAEAAVTVLLERYHGLEHSYGHAVGSQLEMSLVERALVAGRAFWFYLHTLLWPHPLAVIYPRWTIDAQVWWQYLFLVAAAAVIVGLFVARHRIGAGPVVAALCYAILLAPTSGFFNIAFMRFSFVSDHFAYLPSIPLIALATAGGAAGLRCLGSSVRSVAPMLCVPLLAVLAALTAWQCGVYRDPRTLWADTLAKNPECWLAHNNLGAIFNQERNAAAAVAQFEAALQLKPDFAEARNNLGIALQAQGRLDEARAQYVEALRLQPNNVEAYNNLGIALQAQGQIAEAMAQYTEALRLEPAHVKAIMNIGTLFQAQGNLDAAIAQYRRALDLRPDYAEAHNNLGAALQIEGRTAEAIEEARRAIASQPDYPEAHYNLGRALSAQGRTADAISEYREAVRLRPAYVDAHNSIGIALAEQGNFAEAIAHYAQALHLKPDDPEAHNNIGNALWAQQRQAEAIAHYEQALQLKPDYPEAHYNLATVLLSEHRLDEAKAQFVAALDQKPDYAAAHGNLGYLLFEQGHSAEAIAEYEQALRLKPDYPEAHTNLGVALAATGQPTQAVAHYEAALRLKPDHAPARRHLALALAQQGHAEQAIAELEAALRFNPNDGEAREQLRQLQSARQATSAPP